MAQVRDFPEERVLRRSWYDYSWDWVIVFLFATVLLTGIGLWTFSDRPQTAAILEDATTGQSTR
jgi:hypothetical protein